MCYNFFMKVSVIILDMNIINKMLYREALKLSNKIDTYKNEGYNIEYDISKNILIVKYLNSNEYKINIINENNALYWCLKPYKDSYFTTSIDNDIDMVLFTIKENETLNKCGELND